MIVQQTLSAPSLVINSNQSFSKRLWNLIKNPFTYLFFGKAEW